MNVAKLQSNRKLLKALDDVVINRSSCFSLVYLVIYAYLGLVSELLKNHFKLTLAIFFGLLILTGLRFYVLLRLSTFYAAAPFRWRSSFFFMHAAHTGLFSLLTLFGIWQMGESFYSWCLLFWVVGISLVQSQIWQAYLQVNILQQSLLLIPLLVVLTSFATPTSLMAAGTLLLYYLWIIKKAEREYANFWHQQLQELALREKQRSLDAAEAKLARLGDGRQDFLTDLSHEVRTPMTSVLGMMTLLADMGLNDLQKEILQVAQHSGESLLALIDDIMDFSRIASGSIVLDSSVFNLRKCIDDVLETLGPAAQAKRLDLCCLYDENVPMRVRGDGLRINQILHNLISQVIKFSDDGEIIIKVLMQRVSSSAGLLRIDICDQGRGVDKEKLEQLFLAFHKAQVASGRATGVGLGLAISKGLAEAMQGQIGLINEAGQSCVIWFTAHLYLSTQQSQAYYHQELAGKRALIYGATAGLAECLQREMHYWQIQVDVISEGYDQALQALRNAARAQQAYDLLLINMGYVYQEALKLSKIITEDPALTSCKQIFLTSLDQRSAQVIHRPHQPINSVLMLNKPVKQIDLQNALIELFELKRKADIPVFLPQANDQQQNHFKLLLVEDNDVNQMVEKGMLKRLGFAAKVACDGCEALEMLSQEHFDLILMDCQMPNMDGYQATLAIRQQEATLEVHIPIIAMTANAVDGEETRCLAVGMDDVLFKPVNIEELESKLRYWLSQRNLSVPVVMQSLTNPATLH
jgi:hypothetical protein